jgi:hypothetical protein
MLRSLAPLISGLLFFLPHIAQAKTYVFGQAGVVRQRQDTLSDSVTLAGSSFGAGAGVRLNYLEFEAMYSSGKAEAAITHDNLANNIRHSQASLVMAGNFYLTKFVFLRFGYGIHSVEQEFTKPMSAVSTEGARKEYNIVEKENLTGTILGGGVAYPINSAAVYLQIERFSYSDELSAWNTTAGLKFYFD